MRVSIGKKLLYILIITSVVIALGTYFCYTSSDSASNAEEIGRESAITTLAAEPDSETESELSFIEFYPVGKLVEAGKRASYEDGQLRIYIPRLEFESDVLDGTSLETLARGVGLFENAMLPGKGGENANVSIAGHRDVYGEEFYYIDTVEPGDLIYLSYDGALFTYETEDILVTDAYDWDPIRVKEYPCVTLQSCTPIGVASHRIFVVGRLISIDEGADFPKQP